MIPFPRLLIFAVLAGLAAIAPSATFAAPSSANHEILDHDLLEKADQMPEGDLVELLEIYQRKGQPGMVQKIAATLLTKNPENREAHQALQPVSDKAEADDHPEAPLPAEIIKARKQLAAGHAAEALEILEKFRSSKPSSTFSPYQVDYASALDEAGKSPEALAVYQAILDDPTSDAEARRDASKRVKEIKTLTEIAAIDDALDALQLDHARALLDAMSAEKKNSSTLKIRSGRLACLSGQTEQGMADLRKVAADKKAPADVRKDASDLVQDFQVSQLLKEGEGALKSRQRQIALEISDKLVALAPQRAAVVQFRAQALLKNGAPHAAVELLENHNPVDSEDAGEVKKILAQAHEQSGNLTEAAISYRKMGEEPSLCLMDKVDFLERADNLSLIGNAGVALDWLGIDSEEGTWSGTHLLAKTGISSAHLQFLVESHWDVLDISGSEFAEAGKDQLWEASAGARYFLPNQGFLQGMITGHDDGLAGSLAAGRLPLSGPGWQIRYDHDARATDSLALRSLNGRQRKVSGNIEADLAQGLSICLTAYWRQVYVDDLELGDGAGLDLSLTQLLLEENANRPALALGYHGEIAEFSPHSNSRLFGALGLADDAGADSLYSLVDPRINRHELQLTLSRHWNEKLCTSVACAGGYEFEDEEMVWGISGQVTYRILPKVHLHIEGAYDSSGQAANSGQPYQSIRVGINCDF